MLCNVQGFLLNHIKNGCFCSPTKKIAIISESPMWSSKFSILIPYMFELLTNVLLSDVAFLKNYRMSILSSFLFFLFCLLSLCFIFAFSSFRFLLVAPLLPSSFCFFFCFPFYFFFIFVIISFSSSYFSLFYIFCNPFLTDFLFFSLTKFLSSFE